MCMSCVMPLEFIPWGLSTAHEYPKVDGARENPAGYPPDPLSGGAPRPALQSSSVNNVD